MQHPQTREQAAIQPLPADANKAIETMLGTISALYEVYTLETEALENADQEAFFNLQDRKVEKATLYQLGMQELMTRRDEIKSANPALKQKLADKQREFSELTSRNLTALQRLMRCGERLGEIIRDAAKKSAKTRHVYNYGQNGTLGDTEKKSVSMGVNETA